MSIPNEKIGIHPAIDNVLRDSSDQTDIGSLRLSRRGLLKVGIAGTAASMIPGFLRVAQNPQDTANNIIFELKRDTPSYDLSYMPRNPLEILPTEESVKIYEKLNLGDRFPQTLTPDSFHTVSQRITRLATLFFKPDKDQNPEEQETSFHEFNNRFFQKILSLSDLMKVDFVGTLLTWQVSGANNSSIKALREDVRDERARVGTRLAEVVIGSESGILLVDAFRKVDSIAEKLPEWAYALPRLQGPVSLGIHDIEVVMITRSLKDLQTSLPDRWPEIAVHIKEQAPDFFALYPSYIELYSQFEKLSQDVAKEIQNSGDIQEYLRQTFYSHDKLKDFLRDGNGIDRYQFLRTTVFWAHLTELTKLIPESSYQTRAEIVEQLALGRTVDYYLKSGNPSGFFLDQIANPKMIKQLRQDAQNGNLVAQSLYEKYLALEDASDRIIEADSAIAVSLADKEQNLDFQLITGVAYSRWILNQVSEHITGQTTEEIAFTDQDEAAYYAFLATGNREAAPSYLLAGTRPLHRATLTFLQPNEMFDIMDDFINNVYLKIETTHPQQDFRTFMKYLMSLMEERTFEGSYNTNRYRLENDPKKAGFIRLSKEFGAYQKIITLPHSSWMRSLESTVGYIAEVGKRIQQKA